MLTTDDTESDQNVNINTKVTGSCSGLSADVCGQAIERSTPNSDLAVVISQPTKSILFICRACDTQSFALHTLQILGIAVKAKLTIAPLISN